MSTDHVASLRTYFAVFAALLGLTALTVAAAFADLGALNTVVALAIASLKATLVVLYFMHVAWSSRLTWIALAAGLLWLCLLIGGTLHDYLSRAWL